MSSSITFGPLAQARGKVVSAINRAANVLFDIGVNIARVNPVRMRMKAKENTRAKRAKLIDEISSDSLVRAAAESQLETLDEMNFMYNQANSVVLHGDEVLFLGPTQEDEK